MIVNCLINRVEVYRDYKLHIDFNIDLEQFSVGMDIVEIAAWNACCQWRQYLYGQDHYFGRYAGGEWRGEGMH